ncbi:hypothetical protein AB0G74_24605 [Streptomyces sp. NPDC020875]
MALTMVAVPMAGEAVVAYAVRDAAPPAGAAPGARSRRPGRKAYGRRGA